MRNNNDEEGGSMEVKKIFLPESELPRQWYNILADMPTPMEPPLHPGTGKPVGPEDLAPIFPMNLIEQEVSSQRWIDIPEELQGRSRIDIRMENKATGIYYYMTIENEDY
jgi:predicted alternative tryptophan synthase beta-subunit